MNWRKSKTIDNDGKKIDIWISDCKIYSIIQNVNGGKPPKKSKVMIDKDGYYWLFETFKNEKNKETSLGVVETLKDAKLVAEDDGGY